MNRVKDFFFAASRRAAGIVSLGAILCSLPGVGMARMRAPFLPFAFGSPGVTSCPIPDAASPTASLCISGSLAAADPDYNRVLSASTGTGVGDGTPGNCSLSGSGTAVNYDNYAFNITGCAAFPTEVTVTTCGPAGCQHVGNVDTVLTLYRSVAAGDPLTANGGLPAAFNPASACTNAQAAQDDLGTTAGTTNNPGGSTCNQVVGANCVAPCTSPSNAAGLSGLRRELGSGRFQVVVAGFGNGTTGTYNLYVNVPAAGCNVALTTTAAGVQVAGRVTTADGRGVSRVRLTMTDNSGNAFFALTNGFGYYRFIDVPSGQDYVVNVNSKQYSFTSRLITVSDNLTDLDFVAEP
jgi:Carboxypeptidase regulatory-like domain